jgi:hypothetical protein
LSTACNEEINVGAVVEIGESLLMLLTVVTLRFAVDVSLRLIIRGGVTMSVPLIWFASQ